MSIAENKELIRDLFERVWNGGDLDVVEEVFAPGFRFHAPGGGEAANREAFKRFLSAFQSTFPDGRWEMEDLVAEADRVAFRVTFRGKHTGAPLGDMLPTGKTVSTIGYGIFKLSDGKVTELRGLNDRLAILQQLGLLPDQISTPLS